MECLPDTTMESTDKLKGNTLLHGGVALCRSTSRTRTSAETDSGGVEILGCIFTLGAGLLFSRLLGASALSILLSTVTLLALVALIMFVEHLLIKASKIKQQASQAGVLAHMNHPVQTARLKVGCQYERHQCNSGGPIPSLSTRVSCCVSYTAHKVYIGLQYSVAWILALDV